MLPPVIVCHAPPITDGATFRCAGALIRLAGIDAPELSGTRCGEGQDAWACEPYVRVHAHAAADRLRSLTRGAVSCHDTGERPFGGVAARCDAGGGDVAAVLVREGLAISLPEFGDPYRVEEAVARRGHRGVWR